MTVQSGDFVDSVYNHYPRKNSDSYGSDVVTTKSESPTQIDEVSSSEIYLGWAVAGSSANDNVWKIKQIKQTGSVWTQKYPNGDENYLYVWSDRLTLQYL